MSPPRVAPTPATSAPGLCQLGRSSKETYQQTVALTFDDGPHPVNTPKVLDTLQKHGVRATFFVNGNAARQYPELVRRIVAEGHVLGNHTDTHPNLLTLDSKKISFQLSATQTSVNEALGYEYPLMEVRPPYGNNNQRVRDVIQDGEQCMVLWDVDSNDWRYANNDAKILWNIFEVPGVSVFSKGGGVVLMHDVHPQTARVLGSVLDRLEKEGFSFTTTGALLSAKYPAPAPIAPSVR